MRLISEQQKRGVRVAENNSWMDPGVGCTHWQGLNISLKLAADWTRRLGTPQELPAPCLAERSWRCGEVTRVAIDPEKPKTNFSEQVFALTFLMTFTLQLG